MNTINQPYFMLIADSHYNGYYFLAQRINGTILYSREVKLIDEWLKQLGLTEKEVEIKN